MEPLAVRALHDQASLAAVGLAAPVAPPEVLLDLLPDQPAHLWVPAGEPGFSGLGVAARLEPLAERMGLAAAARALFAQVGRRGGGARLRLMGGHAFQQGASADPVWEHFGESSFVLPRWSYHVEDGGAWLTFVGRPGEAEGRVGRAERALIERALERAPTPPEPPAAGECAATVTHLDRERWTQLVERARAEVLEGRCEKIVVARRSLVQLERPLDLPKVLARLRAQPDSTCFAVRRGPGTLVGATPERLVRRTGLRVQTEALAGTAVGAAGNLLESSKDRAEHAPVQRAIVRVLGPRCRRLVVASQPGLRQLADLAHLRTAIEGDLREPTHVLDLVLALHPTPAVAGEPAPRALAFIARQEPVRRGWYAAPVGWCDERGDGDFAVALRCGVLQGQRAFLFAGGGIVAASEAGAEYRETAAKLRPMLSALGVAAPDLG